MKVSLVRLLKALPADLSEEFNKKTNDRQRYSYLLTLLAQVDALSQLFRIKLFHELMTVMGWKALVKLNEKNDQDILNFGIQLHEGDFHEEPDFDADYYRYHFWIKALQSFPQAIYTLLPQNKPSPAYYYDNDDDSDDEAENNSISETGGSQSLLQNVLANSKPQHTRLRVKLAEKVFTHAVSPPESISDDREILINQPQAMDLGAISGKVAARILQEQRFNQKLSLDDAVQLVITHPNDRSVTPIFAKTWRHQLVSICQFFNNKLGAWAAKKMRRDYRAELLQRENDPLFVKLASQGAQLANVITADKKLNNKLVKATTALTQNDFEDHLSVLTGQQILNLVSLSGEAGILWRSYIVNTSKFRTKLLQATGLKGLEHLTGYQYENFVNRIISEEAKQNPAFLEDYVKSGGKLSKICRQEIAEQKLPGLQESLEWPTPLQKYEDLWTDAGIEHIGELFKQKPELWEPKSIFFEQRRASVVTLPELIASHPNLAIISEAVQLIRPIFFKQHAQDNLSEIEASLWRVVKRLIIQDPAAKQRERFLQAENITPKLVKSIPLYMDFELAKQQLFQANIAQQKNKVPGKPLLSKPAIAPAVSQRPREESYADHAILLCSNHRYSTGEWVTNDPEEAATQDRLVIAHHQSKMLEVKELEGHQYPTPGGKDWAIKKAGKNKEQLKKLTQKIAATVSEIGTWDSSHKDLMRKPSVLNSHGRKVKFEEVTTENTTSHENLPTVTLHRKT